MQVLPQSTNGGPSAADSARVLLAAVLPVTWFVRRHMRAHRGGLSVPQFRTLVLVANRPKASLSAIAEHLGSSLPNASRIVSGLVKRGFVTRDGCAHDRRQVSLLLTARGQAVLKTATRATEARVAEALARLSPEQCADIARGMTVLQGVFGAAGCDGEAEADEGGGNGDGVARTRTPVRGKRGVGGQRARPAAEPLGSR